MEDSKAFPLNFDFFQLLPRLFIVWREILEFMHDCGIK